MITDGCVIKGNVDHSVLFSGWWLLRKAHVLRMLLSWGNTVIKRGAKVMHCIVAENAVIGQDAVVGMKSEDGKTGDVATIAPYVTIGDRAVIGPKAMVYNDVEEGQEQC